MANCNLLIKGTAQFKTPVFRIISSVDGKHWTAKGAGQPIALEDRLEDDSQKWYSKKLNSLRKIILRLIYWDLFVSS